MLVKGEIRDYRLLGVSVTEVRVDRELSYAEIYLSAMEGNEREKEIMAGVESASGFIRKMLSERIELRSFPRLRFHWDPTPEKAAHIEKLILEIKKEDEARKKQQSAG